MSNRYTLKIVQHFSAAHILRGYERGCEKLHGHNWRVEIEVCSDVLNKLGMVIDFYQLKQIAKKYLNILDHSYLNDIKPFDIINPTCENVAKWLFKMIAEDLAKFDKNVKLLAINLWETENNSIRYSE